ncbi:MAG TPA: lysophospholipid acyltransferase family protein [Pirellulales bacterium]|jgi:KDO2-lipid IV(A) lauroyltransferase
MEAPFNTMHSKVNTALREVKDYLLYLLVRLFVCFVQAISLETCERVAEWLATVCTHVIPLRRRLVEENLRHAFPDLSEAKQKEIARGMWKHLFLLVAEVAHAPRKIHETNWRDYVRICDGEGMVRRLLDDRPFLIVSGHFGNFELAGFILGILGFPTYSVARPLDNPHLHKFIASFRGASGQHIIPTKGGYDDILAVLASGGTMALLADQYAGSKGCWVDFFGRPASAHKAIALLALDSDAPVAAGYTMRLDGPLKYEMAVWGFLDPRDASAEAALKGIGPLTQWYTSAIEGFVRLAPEQYWWLHDRWKDRRKQRRKKAA